MYILQDNYTNALKSSISYDVGLKKIRSASWALALRVPCYQDPFSTALNTPLPKLNTPTHLIKKRA